MKRDEQACTAVPFHDGLAEHLTQIARIIHTELRKVLADEDLSAVESGVIMCFPQQRSIRPGALRGAWVFRAR